MSKNVITVDRMIKDLKKVIKKKATARQIFSYQEILKAMAITYAIFQHKLLIKNY